MSLPADHPQRRALNDEVHARPPELMVAPLRVTYLALLTDEPAGERARHAVDTLARRFGAAAPAEGASHYSADLGPFRLKWERHTEFTRYKFVVPGVGDDPFADPAIAAVPADWVAGLPGQVMVAAHTALLRAAPADPAPDPAPDPALGARDYDAIAERLFAGNTLVGARIGGGAGVALTDFRIHPDGFSRFLVQDHGMTPRQAGRMVQRLMEIDTYRVLALLALPVARALAPQLARCEHELAQITTALVSARDADEPVLLDRLTRLEAEIESRQSVNLYRFSAAGAYYDLVRQRIRELREDRIAGLQQFHEFTERRLGPAISTCRSVAGRQDSLSLRVARATQLLSTRVDVTREGQNQSVLESLNRRAKMQLRLQETVEGLSVAAVTYYIVGLVGYAANGLHAAGVRVDHDLAVGIAIPVVVALTALGLRRIRRIVTRAV